MKGLFYKELINNRFLPAVIAFLSVFCVLLSPLFTSLVTGNTVAELAKDAGKTFFYMPTLFMLMGYLTLGFFQTSIFDNDGKLWCSFLITTPAGIKGALLTKYLFAAGTSFALSFLCFILDAFSGFMQTKATMVGLLPFFVFMFFLQLLLRSFEIPFSVRFGKKLGGIVKLITFIVVCTALTFLIGLDPGGVITDLLAIIINTDKSAGRIIFAIAFPVISVAAYALSFLISCRAFRKGLEHRA